MTAIGFALAIVASWFASRWYYAWRERERRFSRLVRQFQSDSLIDAERCRAKAQAAAWENVTGGGTVVDIRAYKRRGEGSPAA